MCFFTKSSYFNSQSCLWTEPTCKSDDKYVSFCIMRVLLVFRKRCIRNRCVCFNSHHYFPVEKISLLITDIRCIYLSFKQKITLSTDSETLRFARQSNIQWVICFYGIITKAFIYLVQCGRKEEFNGPLIHCYSDRFVLCRTKWLQGLPLLPKLEKSTAAEELSHLAQKPNLTENLSM